MQRSHAKGSRAQRLHTSHGYQQLTDTSSNDDFATPPAADAPTRQPSRLQRLRSRLRPTPAQPSSSVVQPRAPEASQTVAYAIPDYNPADRILDGYTEVKTLLNGNLGSVTILRSKKSGLLVIRKRMYPKLVIESQRNPWDGPVYQVPSEAALLTQKIGNHANIIKFYEAANTIGQPGAYDIFMEYCSGRDLWVQMHHWWDQGKDIPLVFGVSVIKQTMEALAFLHTGARYCANNEYEIDPEHPKGGIVHGDIRPENILLKWYPWNTHTDLPTVVLADFDAARIVNQKHISDMPGTPMYHAPEEKEIYDNNFHNLTIPDVMRTFLEARTPKGDIWSAGIIFRQLLMDEANVQEDPRLPANFGNRIVADIVNAHLAVRPQDRESPLRSVYDLRVLLDNLTDERMKLEPSDWRQPPGWSPIYDQDTPEETERPVRFSWQ